MWANRGYDEEEPGEEEIMIVPLVDIVFLLLIFFIVTSSFRKPIREWDVKLPDSTYAAKGKFRNDELVIAFLAKQDAKSGKIQVWKNLVYAWSKTPTDPGGKEVKENVTETEMRKVFFAAQSKMTRPVVRMEIDRSVPYFAVAEVLDSLHSFNLRDVTFRARDR
ncbi:hypothetical protein LBMAG53_27670 [Planctomycetota bacterium]|nr:hypothetical protein LBMAG53_27670 [Planctomycetota bacterium]